MNLNSRLDKYKHLYRKSNDIGVDKSAPRPKTETIDSSPQKMKEPTSNQIMKTFKENKA